MGAAVKGHAGVIIKRDYIRHSYVDIVTKIILKMFPFFLFSFGIQISSIAVLCSLVQIVLCSKTNQSFDLVPYYFNQDPGQVCNSYILVSLITISELPRYRI